MRYKDKIVECEKGEKGELVCKILDEKGELEIGSFSLSPGAEGGYEITKFHGSPGLIEEIGRWVVKNLKFK